MSGSAGRAEPARNLAAPAEHDRGPGRRKTCPHPGCSFRSADPTLAERHALEPHIQCSCGRHFTTHAYSAHIGYVVSRRIAHRPFDALPSEIGHDPYRAACDSLIEWAYELNETQAEAKFEGSYIAGRMLALIAAELIPPRERT